MSTMHSFKLKIKFLPLWALLIPMSFLLLGCDKEEDNLIKEPSETSTTITGYVKTPDGTPLANIPVSFDYKVTGILLNSTVHKAKGKTDKSGFYKIFFETDEPTGAGLLSVYKLTVDFSVLPADKYIIAQKVEFDLPVSNSDKWSGSTISCNFSIPQKKVVKVRVVNDGEAVTEGKYAVKNMFPYYTDGDILFDVQNFWDEEGKWRIFEEIEIPKQGSRSVLIPFAIGVENAVQVVYRGDDKTGYPNGVPSSNGEVIKVTDKFNEEIDLKYYPPETRW